MCQRHSGALKLVWVQSPRDWVEWIGLKGVPATWRSSEKSNRAFCPTCGSTLGAIDDAPTIALVLGMFDAPNRKELAPISHSYTSPRPTWWPVTIGDRP